jgi:hypothetical protein
MVIFFQTPQKSAAPFEADRIAFSLSSFLCAPPSDFLMHFISSAHAVHTGTEMTLLQPQPFSDAHSISPSRRLLYADIFLFQTDRLHTTPPSFLSVRRYITDEFSRGFLPRHSIFSAEDAEDTPSAGAAAFRFSCLCPPLNSR